MFQRSSLLSLLLAGLLTYEPVQPSLAGTASLLAYADPALPYWAIMIRPPMPDSLPQSAETPFVRWAGHALIVHLEFACYYAYTETR
jgi:hypothetical protein